MLRTSCFLASVALAIFLPMGGTAAAATLVSSWNMTPDALKVVTDSAGTNQKLTLSGVSWSATTGLFGTAVQFNDDSTLGTAARNVVFDPGTAEFAVTARFRVDDVLAGSSANIAQHGLFGDAGQYKLQLSAAGVVQCRLKGTTGNELITSQVASVDDGAWHVATCWRTASGTGLTVDGTTKPGTVAIGTVAAARPFVVGNKSGTGGALDQFYGDLDCVKFATGVGAKALTEATTGC